MMRATGIATVSLLLGACAARGPDMPTVDYVDLERFMGPWYVIANIPTFIEKGAHNAVETYSLNEDGTIATHFRFNKGGFDGPVREYEPVAWVFDTETNARWGMQFIWPIKADYRIVYLDDDYSRTIIGRQDRDYVWIMARSPQIGDDEYDALVDRVAELGYDTSLLRRVPQEW